MQKKVKVAASILCGDLNYLGDVIDTLNQTRIDLIHFDVMDGQFVPGFGLSEKHLIEIRPLTRIPIEVHLMTIHPEMHIDAFSFAGADIISVHFESCPHLHRTLQKIKAKNISAGVVINPATPVEVVRHVLQEVDIVTLMAIDPGLIGADFLPLVFTKIKELKDLFKKEKLTKIPEIQIDGSLDKALSLKVFQAGGDIAVHGIKSFFQSKTDLKKGILDVLEDE